jgi:hypothetical protein
MQSLENLFNQELFLFILEYHLINRHVFLNRTEKYLKQQEIICFGLKFEIM